MQTALLIAQACHIQPEVLLIRVVLVDQAYLRRLFHTYQEDESM